MLGQVDLLQNYVPVLVSSNIAWSVPSRCMDMVIHRCAPGVRSFEKHDQVICLFQFIDVQDRVAIVCLVGQILIDDITGATEAGHIGIHSLFAQWVIRTESNVVDVFEKCSHGHDPSFRGAGMVGPWKMSVVYVDVLPDANPELMQVAQTLRSSRRLARVLHRRQQQRD